MKRTILVSSLVAATALFAFAHAQTTQPTDAERLAQTAKDFGMTPEQLDRFVRKELGDPVVIDKELIVGVQRDGAGHVRTIKINTPKRSLEFNQDSAEKRPGLQYVGGEIAPDAAFASATDLDGDARIDQVMLGKSAGARPTILLRIDNRFEPATAIGGLRFTLDSDGRTVVFDRAAHNWTTQN